MVQWQNTDVYHFIKSQDSDTYVADQNRMANPYGCHNVWGAAIASVAPSIFQGIFGIIENNIGSGEEDTSTVQENTNYGKRFNDAASKFDKAYKDYANTTDPDKQEAAKAKADKYLETMQANINNGHTYQEAYNLRYKKLHPDT